LTIDHVAAWLDLPGDPSTDDNLALSTAAVKAAVERRRSDLVFTDPANVPQDVQGGAVMWAGILYQARSSPSGFPGFDAETTVYDALGARRAEVMRLIGWRRPVAI